MSRNPLLYWLPILGLGVGVALFAAIALSIGSGVGEISREAGREFSGDQVEALMAFVESDRHPLAERNRAVWALGQLGDKRALPLLRKLYTGRECQHDKYLCQHELRKAINGCSGGFNAAAWVWRGSSRR
jgi:hypothetical protein